MVFILNLNFAFFLGGGGGEHIFLALTLYILNSFKIYLELYFKHTLSFKFICPILSQICPLSFYF